MQKAKSLSYVSHYEIEGSKGFKSDCTYRAWLKKPNYFRLEAELPAVKKMLLKVLGAGGGGGILIGDGSTLWIYWPDGRFNYGDDPKTYEKTRLTSYMTKPAPPGGHSIGHETGFLGAGMSMPDHRSQHVLRIHRLAATVSRRREKLGHGEGRRRRTATRSK